jgi:rhamnulokinase
MSHYFAFDLGAESGRAMLGNLSGGTLVVEELHRFANTPVEENGAIYWDIDALWREIRRGIAIATAPERNTPLSGIGVDTWGVDYGLLGEDDQLLGRPRHYRDSRTNGMMDEVFRIVPREDVFGYTGVQFMQLNTLYQLYSMKRADDPALRDARKMLNIPDLFNYWLTGEAKSEATIASTTQFFNPAQMSWATELFKRLQLPGEILRPIIPAGTLLGEMREAPHVNVFATAGHDTASAVAAVPAEASTSWCYISSGTWSLMGIEAAAPVIDGRALELNFTNEVGVGGKIRLLKNIAGLWLLQECRRAWNRNGADYTYEDLTKMAAGARPFSAAINPDAFLEPGGMPEKIAAHCSATGQKPPQTVGECARAILESLALKYRSVLENLEELGKRRIEVIHIVGGGSRNALLNQFVADCTGRTVIAGPAEATAVGNILVQAMAAGELGTPEDIRAVVRASFAPMRFEPRPAEGWGAAYERYQEVCAHL